jgi:hypothetical protein
MEIFEKLVEIIGSAKEDAEKFYVKGNRTAGTRLRKAMQDAKKLAQDVRVSVQGSKNA